MAIADKSPLQRYVAKVLAALPEARDFYDSRYRERTKKTGKPIYDIERGKSRNPGRETLRVIADILGQPIDLFERAADGEEVEPLAIHVERKPQESDQQTVKGASDDDDTIPITQLDLSLSMGPGTIIDDYVEGQPVRFDPGFLRQITRSEFSRLRLVRGVGDSMTPTLNGGDSIMIDTTQRALSRQDGVYWVSIHGAAGIKRLRMIGPKKVLVVSDNPAVENYEANLADVRIEGRAVWFARDL